ncbi:hypothetical protein EJ05DRAFT_496571 [Pseudovirgaria hyperparasitica]|uniref:Uncharacterized protein n=1 Tax=Pseudovirgaria hyperparasitica TaxID=470096 RepID=A0A6A6WFU6_9PEZI|nr:uncharacterized protein EJ05DRAFT_496571 [Pseudovirgaria hyperparasitica]KAF2761668.1 hypothetical protein EJ05DRAFT_496571 [Pseudovirgaria hyperparasitica]
MFQFGKNNKPRSKCYYTQVTGVSYVDADQPPKKKKPYSLFHNHAFSHTMDVALPEEIYTLIHHHLESLTLDYSRVFLSLSDILDPPFFNHYIKQGSIALLSEGRPQIDNLISLTAGILRLELDKPTYERAGLVGTPIPSGGRTHVKARYAIEFNLRLPCMLHGKKGFERLKYAAQNVLTQSLSFLFVDLGSSRMEVDEDPLAKHHPFKHTVAPSVLRMPDTLCPVLPGLRGLEDQGIAAEVYEWLSLVSLASPRLSASDDMDGFLSRYAVPEVDAHVPTSCNLVRLRWRGLITPQYVTKVWMAVLRESARSGNENWVALNAGCFRGGGSYQVLDFGKEGCVCWEVERSSM